MDLHWIVFARSLKCSSRIRYDTSHLVWNWPGISIGQIGRFHIGLSSHKSGVRPKKKIVYQNHGKKKKFEKIEELFPTNLKEPHNVTTCCISFQIIAILSISVWQEFLSFFLIVTIRQLCLNKQLFYNMERERERERMMGMRRKKISYFLFLIVIYFCYTALLILLSPPSLCVFYSYL